MAIQTVTGQQIIDLARLLADERPAGAGAFVSTADDLLLVNSAISAFYDLLLSLEGQSYFAVDSTAFSTTAGSKTVGLPADFYQLVSVHIQWATDRNEELRQLPVDGDRFLFSDNGWWVEGAQKFFRIVGANLEIYPSPTDVRPVVYRYVPTAPVLANLNQTTPSVNGWHKLPALQIAKELRMIRGQPNGMLEQAFQRELERIETIAAERALNEPAYIRDVYPEVNGMRNRWGVLWR